MKNSLKIALACGCLCLGGTIKGQVLETTYLDFSFRYTSGASILSEDILEPALHQGGIGFGLGLDIPLYKQAFGFSFLVDYQENSMPLIESYPRYPMPDALVLNANKVLSFSSFVGAYLLLGKPDQLQLEIKYFYGWANSIQTSDQLIRTRWLDNGEIKNDWYEVLRLNHGLAFNVKPEVQLCFGVSYEIARLPLEDLISPENSHNLNFNKLGGYLRVRYLLAKKRK